MSWSLKARILGRSLLLQACWSYERMQGLGFCYAMQPWLQKCYGERQAELRSAQLRQLEFFNTQPYMAPLALGMVSALEEEASGLPAAERDERIARMGRLKGSVAASLAGIGDALFWGALRPFCAALSLALTLLAWRLDFLLALLGLPGLYLAAYSLPAFFVRCRGLGWGYSWGDQIAARLAAFPWQVWIRRLRLAGFLLALAVCGLMLASPLVDSRQRWVGAIMLLGYFLVLFLLAARASPYRLYLATCLLGSLAAAGGWI